MRPNCKSAAEALAESPIASLLAKCRRLDRITEVVIAVSRDIFPLQAHGERPRCELRDGTVFIAVRAPSHAAKLRQREQLLRQRLRECDAEVTGIRIRLQPGQPAYPEDASKLAPTPQPTARSAELAPALQFAENLVHHLHDSRLREAARRLQATLRLCQPREQSGATGDPVTTRSRAAGKPLAPGGHRQKS